MYGGLGFSELIVIIGIVFVIGLVLTILPYWMIYKKTGQSGAMSLLLLIPLVNVVMLFILAFGEWPIERELTQLRRMRKDNVPPG